MLLKIDDVSVSFGGLKALQGVSLEVPAGEIRGVIGPNGAGKSTLLNVIGGFNRSQQGRVLFDGVDLLRLKPYQVAACGIARTFQAPHLFHGMTVLENVMTGFHGKLPGGILAAVFGSSKLLAGEREAAETAMEALRFVRLEALAHRLASDLSYSQRRQAEIARAMVSQPRLLLLDEPAAGLSAGSLGELESLIRRLRGERGVTVILIEHVMGLVMGVCDQITVLDYGLNIAEGPPKAIRENPAVIKAYLGKDGSGARA